MRTLEEGNAMSEVYYNENDPSAAAWLRNLIDAEGKWKKGVGFALLTIDEVRSCYGYCCSSCEMFSTFTFDLAPVPLLLDQDGPFNGHG